VSVADLPQTIAKLIRTGEQASYTIEQLIQLLDTGLTVEASFKLIELRRAGPFLEPRSSGRVM